MVERILSKSSFTKAYPTFLKLSELSWPAILVSRKLKNLLPELKQLGRDCLYSQIEKIRVIIWSASLSTGLQFRLDFATDLFARKTPVMTQVRLPIFTDWKDISYNSILVIINRLTKIVYSKLAQISQCTRAGGDNFRRCNSISRSLKLSN